LPDENEDIEMIINNIADESNDSNESESENDDSQFECEYESENDVLSLCYFFTHVLSKVVSIIVSFNVHNCDIKFQHTRFITISQPWNANTPFHNVCAVASLQNLNLLDIMKNTQINYLLQK